MFEIVGAMSEAESQLDATPEEFLMLADLQLALVGGGSGIAQLD